VEIKKPFSDMEKGFAILITGKVNNKNIFIFVAGKNIYPAFYCKCYKVNSFGIMEIYNCG
jgi:hypothetical protein